MLETARLQCIRGDRVLFSDLSFTLKQNELMYLKGVNGSGKTSLLRMLCGLVTPAEGDISWCGENIRQLKEEYFRQLLYIGHLPGIKAELTPLENLKISCAINGCPITEDQAWDALDKIGLRGREDLPSKVLSQGQKRRVALARILLTDAKLWILDEPFTALDVDAVAMLQAVLAEHVQRGGMVLLTTHQEFEVSTGIAHTLVLGKAGGQA